MTERVDMGDALEALDPELRTLVEDTRSCDADDAAFGDGTSRRVLDQVRRSVGSGGAHEALAVSKASRLRLGVVLASTCVVVAFAGSRLVLDEGKTVSASSASQPESVARQAPSASLETSEDTSAKPSPTTDPASDGVPTMHIDELPPSAAAAPASAALPPSAAAAPASAPPPAPLVGRPAPPSKVPPAGTDLAEEYRLIEEGRAGLATGDYAKALRSLGEHERRFPNGQLNQERESLHIEVLVSTGRIAEARERARTFQERFPSGLLMPSVARVIAGSSPPPPTP
ncbi:MAG: hypothetical protein J0I07_02325 [Myxococcales bacterium]|nr:hypothetical protein [Myxococcales bacterium]